ncbi:MAG: serine hydrolase domain-containing protein [Pseudomonadota bacterium]
MNRSFWIFLSTAVGLILWTAIAVFGALSGWWMTALAPRDDADGFFEAVTGLVEKQGVGNFAVVALEEGDLAFEWYSNTREPVNRDTLFPTASFSKFVTTIAILQLVERGQLDLDAPVAAYLSRWVLPTGAFDPDTLTLRRLLSHQGGLTDGLGFGDYAADETLPALEAELGAPRASSGKPVRIAVTVEPGTEFIYSGGGYLVLELVVEEVTGQSFENHVAANIFRPLGMDRSSYRFIGALENIALNYDANGKAAPLFQYASSAATGLNSSAADLVKLAQALLGQRDPAGARLLLPETLALLQEPEARMFGLDIWGPGSILYAPTGNGGFVFGHDGANDPAINSTLRINPETGDAIIALSNGHSSLATTIGLHWVLWQTGYPDPLNMNRVVQSLWLPLGIGCGVIFALGLLLWLRWLPRSAEAD